VEDFAGLDELLALGPWCIHKGKQNTYLGLRATLQLSLDRPGKVRLAIHMEDLVRDLGVDIL
jgi:hypothetical protein